MACVTRRAKVIYVGRDLRGPWWDCAWCNFLQSLPGFSSRNFFKMVTEGGLLHVVDEASNQRELAIYLGNEQELLSSQVLHRNFRARCSPLGQREEGHGGG